MNDRNVRCADCAMDPVRSITAARRNTNSRNKHPGSAQKRPHFTCTDQTRRETFRVVTRVITAASRKHVNGVTLIEVMISLIILTMGMLGMAALHGLGIKTGNQSYYRSQAVNQTYGILDRMRANRAGMSGGFYTRNGSSVSAVSNCDQSPCTVSDIAGFDLEEWEEANRTLLPAGQGSVTVTGSSVSVEVSWIEESDTDSKAETKTVTAVARL